jgi:hypothetical protein
MNDPLLEDYFLTPNSNALSNTTSTANSGHNGAVKSGLFSGLGPIKKVREKAAEYFGGGKGG